MTPEELEKKLTDIEGQLSEAVSKVATLEAIDKVYQEMETEDRDVFATLSKADKEEYVKAGTTDTRKEEILTKAREAIEKANTEPDPADLPEPIRKRLDDIEKRAQEAEAKNKELEAAVTKSNEQIAKAEDAKLTAELVAKAEADYPNLPGTKEEKGAVLKSLYCPCINDAQRTEIFKLLAAGNEALGSLTHELGSASPNEGSSWGDIEKRAIAAFKDTPAAEAVDKFLATEDGKRAYKDYLAGQAAQ